MAEEEHSRLVRRCATWTAKNISAPCHVLSARIASFPKVLDNVLTNIFLGNGAGRADTTE